MIADQLILVFIVSDSGGVDFTLVLLCLRCSLEGMIGFL